MSTNERVTQAIFKAIDEVNFLLPADGRLQKSYDTVLVGPSRKLDSLGLVNLVVAVEQKIEDEFGIEISLVDQRALSQSNKFFNTIRTLLDYITLILEEKIGGNKRI